MLMRMFGEFIAFNNLTCMSCVCVRVFVLGEQEREPTKTQGELGTRAIGDQALNLPAGWSANRRTTGLHQESARLLFQTYLISFSLPTHTFSHKAPLLPLTPSRTSVSLAVSVAPPIEKQGEHHFKRIPLSPWKMQHAALAAALIFIGFLMSEWRVNSRSTASRLNEQDGDGCG